MAFRRTRGSMEKRREMARSSADDEELRRACERALDGTRHRVVMSIRVAKSGGIWGKSGKMSRSNMAKPRVLAICTKAKTQRTKGFLRVLKYSTGGVLEPAKYYKLKHLSKVEVATNDPSGCTFMLGFDNLRNHSVAPVQWTMRNVDDRNRLIVCMLNVCKDFLGNFPKVIGVDVVEMALWAKENTPATKQHGKPQVGPIDLEVAEGDKVTVERELVSQEEEEDLEALLGTYVMGIGEAEQFYERLKRELQALEAANVHSILENESLIDEVLQGLMTATNCVEDIDEWLCIFNVKLRHMREDIESIEIRNNKLEMQSVNNRMLIQELEKLVEKFHIPAEYLSCLTEGSFGENYMHLNIEACEWLATAIEGLKQSNLDPTFSKMKGVKEKRAELEILKASFVRRSAEFLRKYFTGLIDSMLNDASHFSQRGQLKSPDHDELRFKCKLYGRILQHMKSLDKSCLGHLRKGYCISLNLLLRREAREYANELRATVKVPKSSNVWLEASSQNMLNIDSSAVSEAYARMLMVFVPLLVDESSFFANFMCFEVPPPVSTGSDGDGDDADDENDRRASSNSRPSVCAVHYPVI